MVLDYSQLVGQNVIQQQSRLVSEVEAEKKAKQEAQAQFEQAQANALFVSTPKTITVTTSSQQASSQLQYLDKEISKTEQAIKDFVRQGQTDRADMLVSRLEELQQARNDLIKTGNSMTTVLTNKEVVTQAVPIEAVQNLPIFSKSLVSSQSGQQYLFAEIPLNPDQKEANVYQFTSEGKAEKIGTIDFAQLEASAIKPTVQTQTIQQQESPQLTSLTMNRIYSPQESITNQQNINTQLFNPSTVALEQVRTQNILSQQTEQERLQNLQQQAIMSSQTGDYSSSLKNYGGLIGGTALRTVISSPEFVSPIKYVGGEAGQVQVPVIEPTIKFGGYLGSGQYIADFVSNPVGTLTEVGTGLALFEFTPLGKVAEVETKILAKPFDLVDYNHFKSSEIRLGTGESLPPKVLTPLERQQLFIPDPFRKVGDTTFSIIPQLSSKSEQTSLSGIEITRPTYAEQSKAVDVARYPTTANKPRPVYDESGKLLGYQSEEINQFKKNSGIFEQVGDTGQQKVLSDTIYYKIKNNEFVPVETESAVKDVLSKGRAEQSFRSEIFDLRLQKLSSPTGEPFILKSEGTGQASLTGDLDRNLGASKVLNPPPNYVEFPVTGEQVRLNDYTRVSNPNAFDKLASPKSGEFVDIANTENMAILGQRSLAGDIVSQETLLRARQELNPNELFGAPRKTEGGLIEYPETKIVKKTRIGGTASSNLVQPTGQSKLVENKIELVSLTSEASPETIVTSTGKVLSNVGVDNLQVVGYQTESGMNILSGEYVLRTSNPNPSNVARFEPVFRLDVGGQLVDVFPSRPKDIQTDLFGRDVNTVLDNVGYKGLSSSSRLENAKTTVDEVRVDKPQVDNSQNFDFELPNVEKSTVGVLERSSSPYANDKSLISSKDSLILSDATFDTEVISNTPSRDVVRKVFPNVESTTELAPQTELGYARSFNPRTMISIYEPLSSDVSTKVIVRPSNAPPISILGLEVGTRVGLQNVQSSQLKQQNLLILTQPLILSQSLSPQLVQSQSKALALAQSQALSQVQVQQQIQNLQQKQSTETLQEQNIFNSPVSISELTSTTPKVSTPRQNTKPTERPTTDIFTEKKVTEEPFIPKSKIFTERESSSRKKKFLARVKEKGKFVPVGVFESPEEAFGTGRKKVEQTLRASFDILNIETGERVSAGVLPSTLRSSKTNRNIFVQKEGTRLSSRGEVSEIQSSRKKGIFR